MFFNPHVCVGFQVTPEMNLLVPTIFLKVNPLLSAMAEKWVILVN